MSRIFGMLIGFSLALQASDRDKLVVKFSARLSDSESVTITFTEGERWEERRQAIGRALSWVPESIQLTLCGQDWLKRSGGISRKDIMEFYDLSRHLVPNLSGTPSSGK